MKGEVLVYIEGAEDSYKLYWILCRKGGKIEWSLTHIAQP